MKHWIAILLVALGVPITVSGVLLAEIFYSFPILPVMEVTMWDGVVVFSLVAIGGAVMFGSGIRALLRRKAIWG
jgi:hypothetical protein